MKEKQTLIDQVERLKQSEREYELKVQELEVCLLTFWTSKDAVW